MRSKVLHKSVGVIGTKQQVAVQDAEQCQIVPLAQWHPWIWTLCETQSGLKQAGIW